LTLFINNTYLANVLLNNDYLAISGEKTTKKCQNNIFTHGTPYTTLDMTRRRWWVSDYVSGDESSWEISWRNLSLRS
jgi:hypothetical protein